MPDSTSINGGIKRKRSPEPTEGNSHSSKATQQTTKRRRVEAEIHRDLRGSTLGERVITCETERSLKHKIEALELEFEKLLSNNFPWPCGPESRRYLDWENFDFTSIKEALKRGWQLPPACTCILSLAYFSGQGGFALDQTRAIEVLGEYDRCDYMPAVYAKACITLESSESSEIDKALSVGSLQYAAHTRAYPPAMTLVAKMYTPGTLSEAAVYARYADPNQQCAAGLLIQSATRGNHEACKLLGQSLLFENPLSILGKNYALGLENLEKYIEGLTLKEAARMDPHSLAIIAGIYTEGDNGVAADPSKALAYTKALADVGNLAHAMTLANAYRTGNTRLGIEADLKKAVHYHKIVARVGSINCPKAAELANTFLKAVEEQDKASRGDN